MRIALRFTVSHTILERFKLLYLSKLSLSLDTCYLHCAENAHTTSEERGGTA